MHLSVESGLGRALEKFRPLCGKRIALLEANGFDLGRLGTLRAAFELAGAEVVLIAPTAELTEADTGVVLKADVQLRDAAPEVYHALCIPGSAGAVQALRSSPDATAFVESFVHSGKWVATLDNGALLLELGGRSGKAMTSNPSARAELELEGASWASEPVIADQQLVTAQGDAQLEAFVRVATLSFQEKRKDPPPGYH